MSSNNTILVIDSTGKTGNTSQWTPSV